LRKRMMLKDEDVLYEHAEEKSIEKRRKGKGLITQATERKRSTISTRLGGR